MMTRLRQFHDTQVPTIHSLSPLPSPQRRGSISTSRLSNRGAQEIAIRVPGDSLSSGERVGVRGNRSCAFRWVQLVAEAPIARRLAAAFAFTALLACVLSAIPAHAAVAAAARQTPPANKERALSLLTPF